jgi:hypothetical protein
MKFYATTTSDKGGREAKKGGNSYIMTRYYNGNVPIFEVTFTDDGEKRGQLSVMSYSGGSDTTTIIKYSDNDTRTA